MPVQTLPFQSLILIDKESSIPIYHQIANSLIHLITEGTVKPGFKMPSSRDLAQLLSINRTTVTAAYEELKAQDWIESFPKKGIFVSTKLPILKPRVFKKNTKDATLDTPDSGFFLKVTNHSYLPPTKNIYKLVVNDGFPDPRIAPLTTLLREYRTLLNRSHMQGLFMNGHAGGSINLRSQLASFLSKSRAMNVDSENILITRGAQAAIFIAARMLIKPGSIVIVGEPNYSIANRVFEHFGAKLIKVEVDEYGIDVGAIEKICKTKKPALLYIVPHHHHPTTVTLSAERRMKLLDVIRNYRLPVIEDDYDYDFHYDNRPILPLASADHKGYVIYIGSITKTLAPSMRIGYIVASKEFIWQASNLKELIEIRGDVVMEEALACLYKNGEMQKHINRSVKLYKIRRDTFCEMLTRHLCGIVDFSKPSGGMAVWVKFNESYPLPHVSHKLSLQGIYLNDGSLYNSSDTNYNSLRMGFASLNNSEMTELIKSIKEL